MRWLLPLLVIGCRSESVRVDLGAEDYSSAVLAVEDGDDLTVHAFALDQPLVETLVPSYVGSYEVRLTAFLYRATLAELALEEGMLLPASGDVTRPIPTATATRTASIAGAEVGDWIDVDRPSPRVEEFRIDGIATGDCVTRGGCFAENSLSCLAPCPAIDDPAPAAPPMVVTASCAAGWTEVAVSEGFSACAPWPVTPSCSGSDAIFPGDAICHPLRACPSGVWPDDLPPGPRLYVREGGAGNGATEASPLGSIQAAIDQAAGGEIVVIAAGTYASVVIAKPLTLVGACPARTTIGGATAASQTMVSRLTIAGSVSLDEGASVGLTETIIQASAGRAIEMLEPAELQLRDVLIRDSGGYAIHVEGRAGARAVVSAVRVHIAGTSGGISARHAELTVEETIIRGTIPGASREAGRGVMIREGVSVSLVRSLLEDNYDIGMFVGPSTAVLDQIVLRWTKSHPTEPRFGHGLEVQNGADVTVRRSWIDGNQAQNVYAVGAGTRATIEASILSHAKKNDSDEAGYNALVSNGALLAIQGSATIDAAAHSIWISGGEAELTDVAVRGAGTSGIHVVTTGHLRATRVQIEGTSGRAIALFAGRGTLADVTITGGSSGECFSCGGVCLYDGARAENAARIRIEGAHGGGIVATNDGSTFTGTDVAILDTRSYSPCVDEVPPTLIGRGTGLFALEGGLVDVDRFLLAGSAESGAQIADLRLEQGGTSLDLSRGIIRDNAIGTTVSIAGYDLRRVATLVVYSDNDVDLVAE